MKGGIVGLFLTVMKGEIRGLFSTVMKGDVMRLSIWTVMLCAAIAGGGLTDTSRANQTFGPRAIYSPFQAIGDGSETAEQASLSQATAGQDTVAEEKVEIVEVKKPGRAFFMSALVPGLGQWYAEAKIRAAVFFGLETAATAWAIMAQLSGNDKEDEYKVFADKYWDVEKYNDQRYDEVQNRVIPPTAASWYGAWSQWYEDNSALITLDEELTHRLPEIEVDRTFRGWDKTHDYYEMIGKYDQFVYGWDDVWGPPLNLLPGDSTLAPNHDIGIWVLAGVDSAHFDPYIADVKSAHRDQYMNMRHEANKAFKRAKTMFGVILFNHVISAIDAARSARSYNLKHAENKTSVRLRMKKYEGEYIPQLVLSHKFY